MFFSSMAGVRQGENLSPIQRPGHTITRYWKVQVGKDQEKAQSEKDSHSKNRGGKKTN